MAVGTSFIEAVASLDFKQLIKLLHATAVELLKAIESIKARSEECGRICDTINGLAPLYAELLKLSDSDVIDKEGDTWFKKVLQTAVETLATTRNAAYQFILANTDEQDAKLRELNSTLDATAKFLDRLKLRINVHVSTAGLIVDEALVEPSTKSEPLTHREVMLQQLRHFGEKGLLLGDPIRAVAMLSVGNESMQKRSIRQLTQMAEGGHVAELVESGAISAVWRHIQAGGEPPYALLALLAGENADSMDAFRWCGGDTAVKVVQKALEQASAPVPSSA